MMAVRADRLSRMRELANEGAEDLVDDAGDEVPVIVVIARPRGVLRGVLRASKCPAAIAGAVAHAAGLAAELPRSRVFVLVAGGVVEVGVLQALPLRGIS